MIRGKVSCTIRREQHGVEIASLNREGVLHGASKLPSGCVQQEKLLFATVLKFVNLTGACSVKIKRAITSQILEFYNTCRAAISAERSRCLFELQEKCISRSLNNVSLKKYFPPTTRQLREAQKDAKSDLENHSG